MRDKHTQPDDTRQGRWAGRLRRRLAHLPRPDLDAIRDRLPRHRRPPTPPPYPGDAFAAADIRVTDEIIAANPPRFGVNIDISGYQVWSQSAALVNTFVTDGGFEPTILRFMGVAAGGDAVSLVDGVAPSAGDAIPDQGIATLAPRAAVGGFFDGATMRLYRHEDGRVRLLRIARVVHDLATASPPRFLLAEPGPPVQPGDLYVLAMECDNVSLDGWPAATESWAVTPPNLDSAVIGLHRDTTCVAPVPHSRASLRLTLYTAVEGGIAQPVAGSHRQTLLNTLTPGCAYRLELWLRQEGLADGCVRLSLGPFTSGVEQRVVADGAWRQHAFTFKAPPTADGRGIVSLRITVRGPGAVWIDDVRLYQADLPPFALRPEAIAALKAFRPDSLRIWSGCTKFHLGTSLDAWLAADGTGPRWWHKARGPESPAFPSLPAALALARDAGTSPWLIVHPAFDEAEWLGLMEYLAGPPDSPYGARRAADGQVRPWTDVFERISLEYGNETWNRQYKPWTFDSGATYGAFAERFFQVARSSPYFAAVAGKFEFIIGGYTASYGPLSYTAQARLACPSAGVATIVTYVSPVEPLPAQADDLDEMTQAALLNPAWALQYYTEQHLATQRLLTKMGAPYDLGAGEGGMRYWHPTPAHPFHPPSEQVGKSLAIGVAILDAYLYNLSRRFRHQSVYALQPGYTWSSHTPLSRGFRPHPLWLALQLRNQHATGDMVRVDLASAPTVDLPPLVSTVREFRTPPRMGIPLVAAYAFKDGPRYSVFVLSRQLSIPTPVTLRLPARPVAATLYSLSGDPLATNLHRRRVTVRRRPVPGFSQDYRFTLPPASVYLFVVDTEATA